MLTHHASLPLHKRAHTPTTFLRQQTVPFKQFAPRVHHTMDIVPAGGTREREVDGAGEVGRDGQGVDRGAGRGRGHRDVSDGRGGGGNVDEPPTSPSHPAALATAPVADHEVPACGYLVPSQRALRLAAWYRDRGYPLTSRCTELLAREAQTMAQVSG